MNPTHTSPRQRVAVVGAGVAGSTCARFLALPAPQAAELLWPWQPELTQRLPGLAHWVMHASPEWSQTHLEAPEEEVQSALQAALATWLGQRLTCHHAVLHRWRYADTPRLALADSTKRCAWDAELGLGLCGDSLGVSGVEGAWLSARALASLLINRRGSA